jgi:phage pi2 protein 07
LPADIASDEKHAHHLKDKVYIAMTVAKGCVLGAECCDSASTVALTEGYDVFAAEAKNINSDYTPESVNTDGWDATANAFGKAFPGISIILCFLHGFIKIRDCCRTHPLFNKICKLVWDVYKAKNKKTFSQRIRRLKEWAIKNIEPSPVLTKIITLHKKSALYQVYYDNPNGHRTSNMCDRLMRFIDRTIFTRQNFHGKFDSANAAVRSWAILRNYLPYCLRKSKNTDEFMSPASELNGFKYNLNWLENLVTAASMNGYRQ